MRQRITFLHKPEDAIDPKSIKITSDSFEISGLKAAREDRVTFGLDELPQELYYVLKESHELHIRFVNSISYESIAPLVSRLSPGLHVYYTPQRNTSSPDLLCPLLNKITSPESQKLCQSPEKSFTSLPTQRFHHSTAYEYYLPQSHYSKHVLVDYMLQICPVSDKTCRSRVERLRDAAYIDIDFDTISHILTIISFWPFQNWDFTISQDNSAKSRLEIGILSNEKPIEPEELNLAGFLTVLAEDTKPSPTLFSFPARHHPLSSSFSATFLSPTGLHPTLQLRISSPSPPPTLSSQTCSLHAHLTLPRVLFPDKYQLSDPLFLASKNLSAIRHISSPIDLEAPEYTMSLWGSTLLLELAPPTPPITASGSKPHYEQQAWTAAIPLHLRYLPPSESGYTQIEIPWPVVFWACTADEGSKFSVNPFDRVNLGYDALFGPRTMFYHLTPKVEKQGCANCTEGYSAISVPVLKLGYAEWIEGGTAVVVGLGFAWVMWKLWCVWVVEGVGRHGRHRALESEEKKKRQ